MPEGNTVKKVFNKHDKLIVLFHSIKRMLSTNRFNILSTFPKKMYTEDELKSLSFDEAGM